MNEMKLCDPNQYPTSEILCNILGEACPVFDELMEIVTSQEYSLEPIWNFYNDGKAWLCKVIFKKKTVFWLSVWEGYFKTAFYFTEKTSKGIEELNIDNKIKAEFQNMKPIGKFLPLVFNMKSKEQIPDLLKVIYYKKCLK